MLRAVLDANVVASALIRPAGPPGRIVARLLEDDAFDLVLSPAILVEFRRCLAYPRLRKYLRISDDSLERWLASLELVADLVEPILDIAAVAADPEDDKYVAATVEGRADFVVTGDRHLLALGRFEDVRILAPREFLDLLSPTRR